MAPLDLDLPQLGEHAWHTFTADPSIPADSEAHHERIEAVVAQYLPKLDWKRARLLEIGAYRHYTGHLLASRYGCQYIATDLAAHALRDGRARAEAEGASRSATLVVADFHDLPFATDYFDIVFVVASVHHTRRPELVLREMARVLRPGGLLVIGNEPCARACCFHAFVSNRLESLTPFETRLNEAKLLPTLSSPFWGSRPEQLFGMVENDRIPLSLYMEAFADAGVVVERTLASHALIGPLEQKLMALTSRGTALAADVRDVLRGAAALAAGHFGPIERLLEYRLPTECEIHELAARVALLLEQARNGDDPDWRARLFGAAIGAVVRKNGDAMRAAAEPFRREMATEPDGLVRERPDESALARTLSAPLLPDLQATEETVDVAPWFPPEDWHCGREPGGPRTVANLRALSRVEIPPQPSRTLLLMRYFAVVTAGKPYRVRVWGGGLLLDDQCIVLQESRLVRAIVPEHCAEIVVEIVTDDDASDGAPWRLRVGVFQLFAIA